jgi:hypothetical protein
MTPFDRGFPGPGKCASFGARNLAARRSLPHSARVAAAGQSRTNRELERVAAFELEVRRSRCSRHTPLAVCDGCTPATALDSLGFPSAAFAKDRGRYRGCPSCGKLFSIGEWVARDAVLPAPSTCQGCAGSGDGQVAAPAAARA